jgi:hypothetical protein
MSTGVRPMRDFLAALFGPIVWSLHFSGVYLVQALLCTTTEFATAPVRATGAGLTIAALLALAIFAVRRRRASQTISGDGESPALSFAGPLTALSILAILWTSVPLFLLPACGTVGG